MKTYSNEIKNIRITGRDIIELDGLDHTGALEDLGVLYKYKGALDPSVCNLKFNVDLDFILRHGLMNDEIYKKYYKRSNLYKIYYKEGEQAFLDGKNDPCDNPYTNKSIKDRDYYLDDLMVKGYPWYDGYREAEEIFYKKNIK